MNRLVASGLSALIILALAACSPAGQTSPTPTTGPVRATVTDLSVPFAASETDALVPRGFLGSAALGRLDGGCTVEVLKTTERGAQVKVVNCPPSANTPNPPAVGLQGWVSKSALNLKP